MHILPAEIKVGSTLPLYSTFLFQLLYCQQVSFLQFICVTFFAFLPVVSMF